MTVTGVTFFLLAISQISDQEYESSCLPDARAAAAQPDSEVRSELGSEARPSSVCDRALWCKYDTYVPLDHVSDQCDLYLRSDHVVRRASFPLHCISPCVSKVLGM